MNAKIAIATSNKNMFDGLRPALIRIGFGPETIEPEPLPDAAAARDWLEPRDKRLLVLDCKLPERKDGDDGIEGEFALKLIQDIRGSGITTPVLAIMESFFMAVDEACTPASKAIALPLDRHRKHGAAILKPMLAMLGVTATEDETAEPFRVIEVEFFQDWSISRLGYENRPGLLEWKQKRPMRSVREAALMFSEPHLFEKPGWLGKVRSGGSAVFGEHVLDALGVGLYAHIEKAAGGLERLSFRYVINDPGLFPAPFEGSLRDNNQKGRFVLLHAPVVRSLPERDILGVARYPTAVLPSPMRMLFIRSQMSEGDEVTIRVQIGEEWFSKTLGFPPLASIDEEQRKLQELEKQLGPARLIIDVLDLSKPENKPAGEALKKALAAQKYDLIHYAGHAWASSVGGGGSNVLVLPATEFGEAEAFPIETLAKAAHAADARFVYLSACRGSTTRSLMNFVAYGVPHALGFRCDVDDALAAVFATSFYDDLLNSGSLCRSFRVACFTVREKLKNDDENPIWVTPIMLAQTVDWASRLPLAAPPAPPPPPAPAVAA